MGAHIDSINLYLPALFRSPGADDDSSGATILLEAFHVLVNHGVGVQENSLEFHFYSGEEAGLKGSQDVFQFYESAEKQVVAFLQFDTVGSIKKTINAGEPESIGMVTDFVDLGLLWFIQMLVGTYLDIPWVATRCGYACSDHASGRKAGYASALVTEGELRYVPDGLHSSGDTVDGLNFIHMLRYAKLAVAFACELAYAELPDFDHDAWNIRRKRGFDDGFIGSLHRFAAARAADPLGFGLWFVVLVVLIILMKPWRECASLLSLFGRLFRRLFTVIGARRKYFRLPSNIID